MWGVAAASLAVGLAVGYSAGSRGASGQEPSPREPGAEDPQPDRGYSDGRRREGSNRGGGKPTPAAERQGEIRRAAGHPDPLRRRPDVGGAAPSEDQPRIEQLQRELRALREERMEIMGEPIAALDRQPSRFEGKSLSNAVGSALTGEDVGGEVEAADCSEHPCIIFGRLEGDEEDMEEVERSPALSAYEDDVLTLLFWATSVEDKSRSKMPETGLFALAFYSVEERATRGEALDRRIRARVMEYWNTERPGARK